MKFKIREDQFRILSSQFDEDDCAVIELDPVIDTATQAIYENEIRNKAFKMGIERGYREAMYDREYDREDNIFCKKCKDWTNLADRLI